MLTGDEPFVSPYRQSTTNSFGFLQSTMSGEMFARNNIVGNNRLAGWIVILVYLTTLPWNNATPLLATFVAMVYVNDYIALLSTVTMAST